MLAVFEIGGTRIRAAQSAAPGVLGPMREVPTPREDFAAFVASIRELAGKADRIAISTAGAIDPATGLARIANIPCLDSRALGADLEAALGRPVWIGNDADCFALAEAAEGAGRGHRTVFGIILGTGVGGGLVIDGRLLSGAGGFAGEWGHGPVQDCRPLGREIPRFTCGCGLAGCLDAVGSARGIERLHRHLHGMSLDAPAIIAAWQGQEPQATETILIWAEIMAGPLAMVLNTVGATVVPVGGGLSRSPALIAMLDRAVAARRLWQAPAPVIVPARISGEPGMIGASHAGWHGFEG